MPRNKQFDEQEVLEKALILFWKKGYNATSIRDLVEGLGINRASLYTAFGDKEKLFNRAFKHYIDTNNSFMIQFFAKEPQVKTGFKKLFQIAIEDACLDVDRKGCFVVNTTTELIPSDSLVVEMIQKNKLVIEAVFLKFLQKGEIENQFPKGKDLKSLTTMFYTLLSGLKVVSKVETDKISLTKMVDISLSLLD